MTVLKADPVAVHEAVDWDIFRRYTLDDKDLQKDVIQLFRSHSRQYLSDLKYAANAIEWHRAAHTLKGTALTLGAIKLSALAEDAEKIDIIIDNHAREDLTELRIDLRVIIRNIDHELKRVVMHFSNIQ